MISGPIPSPGRVTMRCAISRRTLECRGHECTDAGVRGTARDAPHRTGRGPRRRQAVRDARTARLRAGSRSAPGSRASATTSASKSFDGVPLDANLALPASGDSLLPLVLLHGYGGAKLGFDQIQAWAAARLRRADLHARAASTTRAAARRRAWSTPSAARRAGCAWTTCATRRATRSTWPALLVDAGCRRRADRRDRRVLRRRRVDGPRGAERPRHAAQDGTLAPWRQRRPDARCASPAAAPVIPWSDLVAALEPQRPHARLPVACPTRTSARRRGEAVVRAGLYAAGLGAGYYAPAGVDPRPTSRRWFAHINAGEPYDGDPRTRSPPSSHELPLGLLPRPFRGPGAAADRQRLDRRPVPGRRGAALLQPRRRARVPRRARSR